MKSLPARPDIGHLKRQARRLQRAYRAGERAALENARHYDRAYGVSIDTSTAPAPFSVLDAQRILARRYGFRSWSALARYVASSRDGKNKDHDLARQLLAMRDANVAAIERLRGNGRGHFLRDLAPSQARDADALAGVFDRHGWPSVDRVGHAALEAAFTTVGNLMTQGPLNRLAMRHLSVRVDAGEVPAGYLAMLTDRADLLGGRRVRYGLVGDFDRQGRLSVGNDVVDPANLDRRRATVGHEPIATVRREWFEQAAREGHELRPDREVYYREMEETALAGHWR